MLKKFRNIREHGPGLDIDARILEFLEIFEHYRGFVRLGIRNFGIF